MADSSNGKTLSDYVAGSFKGSELDGLDAVISAIAEGSAHVHSQVQAAALADALGTTGETNVQGEIVQRLDKSSSDTFVDVLNGCGRVAVIGCEEIEDPVIAGDSNLHEYIVLMDPLDGSSNIDVAVSIGSIFGIWRRNLGEEVNNDSLLKPGSEQIAAAYVVYGSSTVLVIATHSNVQGFTLDPETGNFVMTHPNLKIPDQCPYYSTNEGNFGNLDDNTRQAIMNLRNSLSLRYVGSLVADFHRNLLKGGIFLYPADKGRPNGRLRLMYEANPLGFVAEQAGGSASTGSERILDILPKELHQRTALIIGNADFVGDAVNTIGG
ncbi:MAG: fructose-1,6-bisphosphatase [SAR202 cluster bacterium]|nr:fructose-1,6-bisphosphatase [SAR202 cluster bacterium]|tara:strand:- start:4262 stop:5233 length:972 start_codon:yes stop_codon:yes gene_type:complete